MKFGLGRAQDLVPPEAVNAVFAAYEAAWSVIEGAFVGRAQAEIDNARQVLADAIINAACNGHKDQSDLQQEGIRAARTACPDVVI